MRDTEAGGLMLQKAPTKSSKALMRALRLAAVVLGIGLVMASGVARAQDDDDEEEDSKTFEQKIISTIMSGIGGTNMDNRGIDYRERSPLVVPPKIELPPPEASSKTVKQANWPKDPDEARRKAFIEAQKKDLNDTRPAGRILSRDELNIGRKPAPVNASNDPITPGTSTNPMLSPSQLGFNGKLGDLFGGSKAETAPFKGEPTRETLTQPPVGYQTPSPSYAYGAGGPAESLNKPTTSAQFDKY